MANQTDGMAIPPAQALLYRRWTLPRKQWSFWVFLLVGIMLLGGLAIWIELFRYFQMSHPVEKAESLQPLQLAIATAGLAIGGPAAMQLLYSRDKLAIVSAVLLFTVVMICAMYLMVFGHAQHAGTLLGGCACLMPAILAWMLANGEDDIFQDETRDDTPVGGNPLRALPPVAGRVKV